MQTFGSGERRPSVTLPNISPSPDAYTLPSPFIEKKQFKKCTFGGRAGSILHERSVSPGPAKYSLPSFVDPNRGKQFSLYPRIEPKGKSRQAGPGPTAYEANYSLVETMKTAIIGKSKRLNLSNNEDFGPGLYTIKSRFDDIADFKQKKMSKIEKLRKMKEFNPCKKKTRANILKLFLTKILS